MIKSAALLAALAAATPAAAQTKPPVVVELFTSQGCSSCPPANAAVNRIAGREDVLALTFGVEVWDGLGWKDTFAHPAFTNRQRAYNRQFGRGNVYTPQVVVDGRIQQPAIAKGELEDMVRRAGPVPATPAAALQDAAAVVGGGPAPKRAAQVWMVRYDPRTLQVPIRRGENGGKTLPHRNVVVELVPLGDWSGAERRFSLPAPVRAGLKTAVLVQDPASGRLLGAGRS